MSAPGRFAIAASAVAVVAAAAGLPWVWSRWDSGGPWALGGWGATTLIGVATGAWLAAAHGRPGPRFLAALVTGILARMVLLAAGLFFAARQGREPVWGFLSGFALAFVPLLTHEVVWSIRVGRNRR